MRLGKCRRVLVPGSTVPAPKNAGRNAKAGRNRSRRQAVRAKGELPEARGLFGGA